MGRIIGIDAGGTKTQALVMDEQQNVLFESVAGHGNPSVSFQQAMDHLTLVLNDCLQEGKADAIVIGMAGLQSGPLEERVKNALSPLSPSPMWIISDAELAFDSAIGEGDGILTIAGTGSISHGRNGTMTGVTGGWGHLLGDEGSAYSIAIQACQIITTEFDQHVPLSPLSQAVMKKIGAVDGKGLKGFIYTSDKGEIASLSQIVDACAQDGDASSRMILQKAGASLGMQTVQLARNLSLASLRVAIKGSVLEASKEVQTSFKQVVAEAYPDAAFHLSPVSPALGAVTTYTRMRRNH
ncbi:N-acetylglucosamine kinase-like BadF-type ATPase [Rossellomorea marisflavi]